MRWRRAQRQHILEDSLVVFLIKNKYLRFYFSTSLHLSALNITRKWKQSCVSGKWGDKRWAASLFHQSTASSADALLPLKEDAQRQLCGYFPFSSHQGHRVSTQLPLSHISVDVRRWPRPPSHNSSVFDARCLIGAPHSFLLLSCGLCINHSINIFIH